MAKRIEVQGKEIAIRNSHGDIAIIPIHKVKEVESHIASGCHGCIDAIVDSLPKYANKAEEGTIIINEGDTLSAISKRTGVSLDELAKFNNISNPDIIKAGQSIRLPENKESNTDNKLQTSNEYNSFSEAFKHYRQELGANQLFSYNGRTYGTNIQGEKLEVDPEILKKFNLDSERIQSQNKQVESLYSSKKTVKVEPQYEDFDKIKQQQLELNNMDNADTIIKYHASKSDTKYAILDKSKGVMHIYQGDKEISSYKVATGKIIGDEQTSTTSPDGHKITSSNYQTGAGIYTVSNSNPSNKDYSNVPSFNFINSNGIEVPMALHAPVGDRAGKIKDNDPTNNRLTTGCINGLCKDLTDIYKEGHLSDGTKLYILPDDSNNSYVVKNDELQFTSKEYDPKLNTSIRSFEAKPIKIENIGSYTKEGSRAKVAYAMAGTLSSNKQYLMKDLRIDNDTYNNLSKLVLGIAGQESDYGGTSYQLKENSIFGQSLVNAAKEFKGNSSVNSRGLLQIKYDIYTKNPEINQLFKKYGINNGDDLNNPDKAAKAGIIVLSSMYNNELPSLKSNIEELNITPEEALLYLYQGKKGEITKGTATPDKNLYIQAVNNFSNNFRVTQLH